MKIVSRVPDTGGTAIAQVATTTCWAKRSRDPPPRVAAIIQGDSQPKPEYLVGFTATLQEEKPVPKASLEAVYRVARRQRPTCTRTLQIYPEDGRVASPVLVTSESH